MIYLDTCALVKLVVAEKESAALADFLADHRSEMVSSQLALTELIRVVRRSCFDAQRRPRVAAEVRNERLELAATLLDRIDLVVVGRDLFIAAGAFQEDPFVGSLDAIHLAAARAIGPGLSGFVTYDKALARAAVSVGLPVVSPA